MVLLSLYYTRDFYSWKVAILFYAYYRKTKSAVYEADILQNKM
jgi:hypothetical protein